MQELAKDLKQFTEQRRPSDDEPDPGTPQAVLRDAAKCWVTFCVNELDGELLRKGLMVGAALCEFLNEWERPATTNSRG